VNGGRNSRRQSQPRSTPLTHDSYPAIVAQTRWRGACSSLCRRLAHGVVGAPVPAGSSRRVAGRASLTARGRRTARRTRCTSRCAPAKPSAACAPTVRFPPSATPSPWPLAGAFGSFSSVFRTTISISSSRPMIQRSCHSRRPGDQPRAWSSRRCLVRSLSRASPADAARGQKRACLRSEERFILLHLATGAESLGSAAASSVRLARQTAHAASS